MKCVHWQWGGSCTLRWLPQHHVCFQWDSLNLLTTLWEVMKSSDLFQFHSDKCFLFILSAEASLFTLQSFLTLVWNSSLNCRSWVIKFIKVDNVCPDPVSDVEWPLSWTCARPDQALCWCRVFPVVNQLSVEALIMFPLCPAAQSLSVWPAGGAVPKQSLPERWQPGAQPAGQRQLRVSPHTHAPASPHVWTRRRHETVAFLQNKRRS